MNAVTPTWRRAWAALAAAAVVLVGGLVLPATEAVADQLPYPAGMQERLPSTVSANPLPTVQIDSGVVWSLAVVGNTVYAGGNFANVRPAGAAAGTNRTPRGNFVAFDIRTGQLNQSFAPSFNGQVKVVRRSPDGSRIYVGGSFTSVTMPGGTPQTRFNIAAFSTATGELLTSFRPAVGGSYVNAIAATDTAVYVGGLISAGNGVSRQNLMAFSTSTGALLSWAPTTNRQVDTMVMTPDLDKVVVGGRFTTVNGVEQRGLVALHSSSGAVLPWIAPTVIKNGYNDSPFAGKAGIYALSADATAIYGTGWVLGTQTAGNFEGVFAVEPDSGAIRWLDDCRGDTYDAYSDGMNNVYKVGHAHDCVPIGAFPQGFPEPGNLRHSQALTGEVMGTLSTSPYNGTRYKDWSGWPAPAMRNWFPDWTTGSFTGQGQAAWTVTGSGDYVVVGGEFPYVNGQLQQGLVRFGREGVGIAGTGTERPRLSGASWTPTALSVVRGTVRVSIPENWDRDDMSLTYQLFRTGVSAPVATSTSSSTFWDTMTVTLKESGLTPGQTYSYRVVARDPDGNTATSSTASVTVASTAASAYSQAVLSDNANLLWQLGGPTSSAATDWADGNDGAAATGVGSTAASAILGDSTGATTFDGTSNGRLASNARVGVGDAFTLELWMRTTTTSGGKLIGYGNRALGSTSNVYDRHIYMRNDGRLTFGVNPGPVRTITSTAAYNDGQWHHVAATLGSSGMTLMVDGVVVASNTSVTSAQKVIQPSLEPFVGYWRIGGDSLSGWPTRPSSDNFRGDLDAVAVYPSALSQTDLREHHQIAKVNQPPVHQAPDAVIASTPTWLSVAFDGTQSVAYDGATIAGYAWDFGDGETSSELSPVHVYDAAGTYEVTLVVTDSQGVRSGTAVASVTVSAAPVHQAPEAVIASTATGLSVQFDGTQSVAHDGATIIGYAWDFGDGTTSTQPSPVHAYAAAGTYVVTLVVTDSEGAVSQSTSASVAVSPTVIVANDVFSRTVASGWGSADVGGAWTTSSGLSVSGGRGLLTSTAARQTRTAYLAGVSAQDVDATLAVSLDKQVDGSGAHVNVALRRTTSGEYRLKLIYSASGAITVHLARLVGTTETLLASRTLSGTFSAGEVVNLRFQAETAGASTTLRSKVWRTTDSEPSTWLTTASDSQSVLQVPGQVGVSTYLSGTVTTIPLVVSIDDLLVTQL